MIILLGIGLIAAFVGSIVGLGGGIIIVPGLALLSPYFIEGGLTTAEAVGTSLTVLIFSALTSTLTYAKQRRVDYTSGWLLFATSGPAAIVGAAVTTTLNSSVFFVSFGLFMMFMALLLVFRDRLKPVSIQWKRQREYTDPSGVTTKYGYNLSPLFAIGLLVGFISGLFGIGGGSLFVPMMVLLFRFPAHVATATSMFVIFLSALSGSVTHLYMGNVEGIVLLALLPGALIGGWLGARVAGRMSGKSLLYILRVTLFILSIYLIWQGIN